MYHCLVCGILDQDGVRETDEYGLICKGCTLAVTPQPNKKCACPNCINTVTGRKTYCNQVCRKRAQRKRDRAAQINRRWA